MIACADDSAFEWIRAGCDELLRGDDPRWVGNSVSHLMPPVFESYAKLLHQIDASYKYLDNPLPSAEEKLLNVPRCNELVQLIQKHRAENSLRVRWRELADLYQLPYQRHINLEWFQGKVERGCWPRYLSGPDEGQLNEDEFLRVCFLLEHFTDNQEIFARFALMPFISAEVDKPPLFKGSLSQLHTVVRDRYPRTPEYWWPEDHSWCLCSDYDLTFTVMGGPRALIEKILNDDFLEAIEVTRDTRIDYKAPIE